MPLFSIYAMDRRPEGPTIRAETRPAHLEYLRRLGATVKLAGPVLCNDQAQVAGSLIIVEAESIDAATAIANDDPYAKAGLFASSDVREFKAVFSHGIDGER